MIEHSQNNTAHSYIIRSHLFCTLFISYIFPALITTCGAQSNQGDDDFTIPYCMAANTVYCKSFEVEKVLWYAKLNCNSLENICSWTV